MLEENLTFIIKIANVADIIIPFSNILTAGGKALDNKFSFYR